MADYHITICDDNVSFVRSIAAQCEEVMEKLHITCSIKSLYSFEDVLRDYSLGGRTDLLLLDIMLGRKNGIDLAQKLKDRGCDSSIVLMTTEKSYLLAGYAVQPIYFLIKPIDTGELEKAIKLDLKRQAEAKSLVLKCEGRYVQIPVESIQYIEVLDHELTIHTRKKDYTMRMTFAQILKELPSSRFVRCHNSYVVNLSHVSNFSRTTGVALDCRVTLPLGRKYFDEFRRSFVEFINTY